MPDADAIERRLAAVERALADGHDDLTDLGDEAALAARLDEVEGTATRLERRVADLEAAVQALRGYVGNVRHVNRAVERRADAALATACRAADGDGHAPAVESPGERRLGEPDRERDGDESSGGGRPPVGEPRTDSEPPHDGEPTRG